MRNFILILAFAIFAIGNVNANAPIISDASISIGEEGPTKPRYRKIKIKGDGIRPDREFAIPHDSPVKITINCLENSTTYTDADFNGGYGTLVIHTGDCPFGQTYRLTASKINGAGGTSIGGTTGGKDTATFIWED